MTSRTRETVLNVWLADELRKRGLDAKEESAQTGNRAIDVEVRIGPVVVAVEAKHGQTSTNRREAIDSAAGRLEQNLAQCAVAVCYPDGTTRESLPHSDLIWTVRDRIDDGTPWTSGDIDQLASVIRLTPAQLGDPDYAAAALSNSLDEAVRRLSEAQRRMLARTLDLPSSRSGRGRRAAVSWNHAAKRALLVVATAVMFHSRLDTHLAGLRPEHDNRVGEKTLFTGDWPPNMAHRCAHSDDPISAFWDAWDLILALDYKPIFETGCAALHACPPDPAFSGAIRETARAALAVSGSIASLRHDLLGRIFHTVLDSARYDGSFYTTTAAATLLASLAITEDLCDWSDPEAIANLRITDPACGTGTLLMAAAERIRELAPRTRDEGEASRSLIEHVLSGYDVNLTATHMAATTLGLLSPSTRFHNMKIGRAFLGVDDAGDAYLGSLEFLDQNPKLMPWPNAAQTVSQIDSGDEIAQTDPADLVIINPPFTRDSLRHDQFSRADETKLKAREKRLFAKKPVHLSSMGSAFLVLADYINKAESSTIAAVMPLVAATNKSGFEIRRYLASRYHVETIVTSHDPGRIYFSENTSIGEMLLICRRWPDSDKPKPPTRIVNLAVNPPTPSDAISVAWAVENGRVEGQGYGTVQEWPESRIAVGDWGAVQFLSPYLCERFSELARGDLFRSTALGEIAKVGPAGQRIREAYRRSSMPDAQGRMALWQHDTNVTQTMSARPDTHIAAKPQYAHRADRYWEQRSRLLLPTHLRLTTARATTVRLDTPVVGSLWVPCNIDLPPHLVEEREKALCLFLNSSVGILSLLGDRTNKSPSYPNLSIDDLRKLTVPDFTATGESAIQTLATTYDSLADRTLLPLSRMDSCETRRALDAAICAALDIDPETVHTILRSLAAEPSITGKRYARTTLP